MATQVHHDKADRIEELLESGHCIDAYEIARGHGPLDAWRGARAGLVAGRLAHELGAPRLGLKLTLRAYRRAPSDPALRLVAHSIALSVRGPLEVWHRLRKTPLPDALEPKICATYLRLRARVAMQLGDYDAAAALLAEGERDGKDPSLLVARAHLLAKQDRYQEALETSQEALALRPLFPGALHATADLLLLLDRREEAIELLLSAEKALQLGDLTMRVASMLAEDKRLADALALLDRFETFSPLLEPAARDGLARARAHCRDELDHHDAAPVARRRVLLNVGFVRQHHLGCVPAVLSMLCRFWEKEAEHLEISEAICYDGTPAHAERRWAEENGFSTRFFTVTWESAVALLDNGIPFTLATAAPGRGHLQAVIGYDSLRGSLALRDPFIPTTIGVEAEAFLAEHRASGPRGMALVPREQESRLEALRLPEVESHDALYEIDHRRANRARSSRLHGLRRRTMTRSR